MTRAAFEQAIVSHCAPTLAGCKAGCLFCTRTPVDLSRRDIVSLVSLLARKGVKVRVMKGCASGCQVYVYRPKMLSGILRNEGVKSFLLLNGYENAGTVEEALDILRERFENGAGFPHEMGIFLGYPLEDVRGFILNGGRNYCLSGLWKVYDCPARALACFRLYRECRKQWMRSYLSGTPIASLVKAA